jgi:hypothetical protein
VNIWIIWLNLAQLGSNEELSQYSKNKNEKFNIPRKLEILLKESKFWKKKINIPPSKNSQKNGGEYQNFSKKLDSL